MKLTIVGQLENPHTGLGKALNDIAAYAKQAPEVDKLTCLDITRNTQFLGHIYHLLTCPTDVFYMTPAGSLGGILRDACYLMMMQVRRKPIVLHFHNSHFGKVLQARPWLKSLNRWIYRRVDRLIILGQAQRLMFEGLGIPDDRFELVANGVDPDLFIDKVTFKAKTGRRLIYFSNMLPAKGYQKVLDLARLLADEDYELIFSGKFFDPDLEEDFLAQIADLPHVTYLAGVYGDQKAELLRQMDYFILPSTYPDETLPISMLEAMASGCQVIVSDVGVIREYVLPATSTLLGLEQLEGDQLLAAFKEAEERAQRLTFQDFQIPVLASRFDQKQVLDQILRVILAAQKGAKDHPD